MFATITSILIALSLLLGGTGAAVYASQDSQPGEMLYTVKTTGEDFQYRLTNQAELRVELALKFAARRVSEALAMAENGKQIQENLAKRLEVNLNNALQAAAEMDDTESGLEKVKSQVQILKRTCDQVNRPDDKEVGLNNIQNMLQHKLMVVEQGLEAPLTFRHAFQNRYAQEAEVELLETVEEVIPSPSEEPIVDDDTPKGPAYGDQTHTKNKTGEGNSDGLQTQSTESKGSSWGPGDPLAQPDEPIGPNESSGFGPGEQFGNPDSGNPETGNPDSGNPETGNPDSGNPDSGNPDSGNPDSGSSSNSGSGGNKP